MSKKSNDAFSILEDLTDEFYRSVTSKGIVAIDCEMTGLNPHRDLLCLVQLCDQDKNVMILRTKDWHKAKLLKQLLINEDVTKVFHFAIMDSGFLMTKLSVEVKNAFCTKIASKLVRTYTDEHGLAALVKELLQIEIDKSEQSTFWLAEELSLKQLRYAANDVLHLIEIKEILEKMLEQKGTLPTGISYSELNRRCQNFIPTLTHLWINGWDFGRQEKTGINIFGR